MIAGTLLLLAAAAAQGQGGAGRIALAGTIIEAESGAPLAYAAVTLDPAPAGVLPPGAAAGVRQTRVALTDTVGRYRFENVAPGDYRLHVQRTGYHPRTVDVRVRPDSDAFVSVGLQVEPVELDAVSVTPLGGARVSGSYARRAAELEDMLVADALRTAAELLRQREYLATDVRVITHADVMEGVTLGETDLFRSLQRLPGVAALDDWSAALLTRGAPWDQTRVYFDGVPVFNTLHALGVFAGINADAVGAAFLHPGVQPAWLGGAAAGTLDIRSRSGSDPGRLAGVGELSLASARLALDRRAEDDGHAWMIAGRRSYLDAVTRALTPLLGEDVGVPYAFFDLAARGDIRLANTTALEVSGMITRDHAYDEIFDVLEDTRAAWGAGVARATLATRLGGASARHTIGYSGNGSTIRDVAPDDPDALADLRDARNRLDFVVLRGEAQPVRDRAWSAGYEVARYRAHYLGRDPTVGGLPASDTLRYDAAVTTAAGWVERRVAIGTRVTADLGLRAEGGRAVAGRGRAALAPRASARVQLGPRTMASAGFGRGWQYTQSLVAAGIAPVPGFASDFLWLLASDTVPALRADIATAGVEHWLGGAVILAANGWVRRANGLTIPDPEPGVLVGRPTFVRARNHAHGAELSLRRITGPWTGSLGYAWGRSTLHHDTLSFAAPADRRHAVDATLAARLGSRWLVGAAYTGATGTPYTRRWAGGVLCDDVGCQVVEPPRQGEPAAERRVAYHALDLNLEWRARIGDARLTTFVQVRNVLGRDNQGRYAGTVRYCEARCGFPDARFVEFDEFTPAMPTVPLVGLRLSF